jgi:hypothetical protein
MRFKVIAAFVVVAALMGASAGVALATTRTGRSTTAVEHIWAANFNPKTTNPTVFVGTGLFTDAGKITGPSGDKVTLSKGGFLVNGSKITAKFTANHSTCFITLTFGGSISLNSGKGAYKGISGKIAIAGKIVGVLPRLKNGNCNGANNAVPLALVGTLTGSGEVTLPSSASA